MWLEEGGQGLAQVSVVVRDEHLECHVCSCPLQAVGVPKYRLVFLDVVMQGLSMTSFAASSKVRSSTTIGGGGSKTNPVETLLTIQTCRRPSWRCQYPAVSIPPYQLRR